MRIRKSLASLLVFITALPSVIYGWGPDGHRFINRVAALHMSTELPTFFRSAADRMEYLGPEPDRWRTTLEPSLKNAQEPEHYIDLELLNGFGDLPRKRFDYYKKLEAFRLADSAPSPAVIASGSQTSGAQTKRDVLVPERVGLQPWIVIEVYERLVVAFREYRELLKQGKPTKPAEDNAIFYAGWLGHYVGDGANPMHTSIYFNGWVGPNPHGFTTSKSTHYDFESRFVHDNIKVEDIGPLLHPATQIQGDVFLDYLAYLRESNALIDKTYELEKAGAFKEAGTREGREFVIKRLTAGSQKLIDLCYTAWINSAKEPPPYKP